MDNITAKVSCFARAYHYNNNSIRIFTDDIAEKLLGEDYNQIAKSMSDGIDFFCPGFEGTREEGLRLILDRQLSPSVLGRSVFCESKLAYAIANGCKQYGQQVDYMYGEALYKPEMKEGNPIRLYSLDEITEIFGKLGLRICNSFADFSGKPSSDNDIQLMVYSIRE